MFKAYLYVADYGDGSAGVRWFLDSSLDEDLFSSSQLESFSVNEGSPACTLVFSSKEMAIVAGIPKDIGYFEYGDREL